jgi:cell division protein FtsL
MSQYMLRIALAVLWVAVLVSALGVVYGKQEARNSFNELQKLTTQRDDLDIEWGQLQLEQSTWATHGRVERFAHDELGMVTPAATDLRIVQP